MALATVIFGSSLVLLLLRPRRVPDWVASLGGGLAMVVAGLLPFGAAAAALADAWNVFVFFLGLGISAAVADRAGVFRTAAAAAARLARGSQRRLLIGIYVTGILVTAVLSNDATALLLTPVAFAVATRLGLDPRPYAFACALVANAGSFLLPVSNPSNLLVLAETPLPFGSFLARLLFPSVLALAATLAGLLLHFRTELAEPFQASPDDRAGPNRRSRVVLLGVAGLAVLYVAAAAAGWPLGPAALVGGLLLVALDTWAGQWEPQALAREIPWALFPLFGGLLLLVQGAERTGVFTPLANALAAADRLGVGGLPLAVFGLALLANLVNNLPAALVAASALGALPPDAARANLAAAVIVGVSLGPNLTTVGSLATMLWLVLLRRRGVDISVLEYLRVGTIVTVPALLAAAVGLWVVVWVLGG